MDPRFLSVLSRQRAAHFAGLAGSDVRVTLRVSTALLNEIIRAYTSTASAIRGLRVIPQVGNRFDVHLKLEKPALLPALNLTLVIEKQPELPADTTLGLRLTGGGGIMRFAGSAVKAFGGGLPSGVRIDGDHISIDIRALLRDRGQAELLDYAEDLAVATEEGIMHLLVHAREP